MGGSEELLSDIGGELAGEAHYPGQVLISFRGIYERQCLTRWNDEQTTAIYLNGPVAPDQSLNSLVHMNHTGEVRRDVA